MLNIATEAFFVKQGNKEKILTMFISPGHIVTRAASFKNNEDHKQMMSSS